MSFSGARGEIDLHALRRGRHAKTVAAMTASGVDAIILTKAANIEYATGATSRWGEASYDGSATAAALMTGVGDIHLFTHEPGGAVTDPAPASTEAGFVLDDPHSVAGLVRACRERVGIVRRLAIDRLTAPLAAAIRASFGGAELVDADVLLASEKMRKTPEEIECLRRAQALNEAAMHVVVERIRPGVPEVALTGMFMAEMARHGVRNCHVEPVWCALPRTAAEALWPHSGAPYRELTSSRLLEEGDLVVIDTGVLYEGYMSDFGRTWYCTASGARPSAAERDLYRRWREIADAVAAACRPGATCLGLRRAACDAAGGSSPWPLSLYLAHGIGLGGVEPPFVGTDLGEAAEEQMILHPRMVLVIEPYVWVDGVGGYRAEESYVITERGADRLTDFPHGALAEG
jgi:Xaa-Pro aminopeptidase